MISSLSLLTLLPLACGPDAAPGDVVENALIRVTDQGKNPELRWGLDRSALPEGIKGPALDPLPLPPEATHPDVDCVELAGQGLVSVPVRFDRTYLCFFRDEVYLRGAWRRLEGEDARHECTSMVEGMSQEYGVGVLPLGLEDCVRRYPDEGRPAHCERKVRSAQGDDRVRHTVQVEHYGPPRTRIELEEKLHMQSDSLYMEATALRIEPKSGSPWCTLNVVLAEAERRSAAQSAAAAVPAKEVTKDAAPGGQ